MGRLATLDRDSVGILGVLLVTRPGFAALHPAALLSLGSAICYSIYVISTRVLARSNSNETTLFYSNLVGAVAMLPVIPFVWSVPENALCYADGDCRRARQRGALLADRGPPPCASLGIGAVHLYPNGMDHDARFFSFRRCAVPVDDRGGLIVVSSGLYLLDRERKVGKDARRPPRRLPISVGAQG